MTKLLLLNTATKPNNPLELLPGIKEAITRYKDWTVAITSNQTDLVEGLAEMQFVLKSIPQIKFALFCPDSMGNECYKVSQNQDKPVPFHLFMEDLKGIFRKPNDGMIRIARHMVMNHLGAKPVKTVLIIGEEIDYQVSQTARNYFDSVLFMGLESWLNFSGAKK